jgi:O-antigen biosynthesis protein WbqV
MNRHSTHLHASYSPEELLGRPQIALDGGLAKALIAGKRVLVTGAGGSIGSEIVRHLCSLSPAALALIDASEFNLYSIDAELAERMPGLERLSRLIDVRHRAAVRSCFAAFRPDIVFHAAALKHVPLVEDNPVEGIWTNAVGTRHVADAAMELRAAAMVLLSTDKAVEPASTMGAAKRCAEIYCQASAVAAARRGSPTRFVIVRFGNVLGSAGSVAQLFARQIGQGGPVTVTHPEVERFFMTVQEAVQLVLQASAMGTEAASLAGKVFVLDMGPPVKIVELARRMIRSAGLRPDLDVAIQIVGLRPGEKLSEELFHDGEPVEPTSIPSIEVASPRVVELARLTESFDRLEAACLADDAARALAIVRSLVPEFKPADEAGSATGQVLRLRA